MLEPRKDKKNRQSTVNYQTEEQLRLQAQERQRREAEEEAVRPKPESQKKWENFWFHYKTRVFALVAVAGLLGFAAWEFLTNVKPDVNVVLVAARYITDDQMQEMVAAMEAQITDLNGDGKVSVAINYIPYAPDAVDMEGVVPADQILSDDKPGLELEQGMMEDAVLAETDYANTMKLTTLIAAGEHPIFLMDEENYKNLVRVSQLSDPDFQMFRILSDIPGSVEDALPIAATDLQLIEKIPVLDGMNFYYRNLTPTNKTADYIDGCYEFLRMIAE